MRFDDVRWLEIEHVQLAHAEAMRWGLPNEDPGVRDPRLLESALLAPRNAYSNTLAEIAARLTYGLVKNHAYENANKRTAAIVLVMFLEANGYPVVLTDEWVEIFEHVADGRVSREKLTAIIVKRLLGGADVSIEP